MKKISILVGVLSLALAYDQVLAQNGVELEDAVLRPKPDMHKPIKVPDTAIQLSPTLYYLGETFDSQSGQMVEGYMHVTRHEDLEKSNAKPPWAGNGGNGGGDSTSTCYADFGKGVVWKNIENWIVNPANTENIAASDVFSLMDLSVDRWEDAADGKVGDLGSVDIFGEGSTTSATLVADTQSTDGLNEVYFGSIADPGVIAVTITWGIFGGPPQNRGLVEWDQVYDQADFSWNTDGNVNDMDFLNIAIHEVGHAMGLDHPESTCVDETMYAYATEGETKKRDLNSGDIAGIDSLY